MSAPFKAWIIPVEGDAPGGGTPPGIWGPTDPRPGHPIYIPGWPPLSIWGPNDPRPGPPIYIPGYPPLQIWGPNDPRPGTGLPGDQPGIWGPTDPRPSHPIHLPPIFPPGQPSHPIFWPPTPEHPIVIPPKPDVPPPDLKPEHPIVLPPAGTGFDWQMVFVPANGIGWVWALIPNGNPPVAQPKK